MATEAMRRAVAEINALTAEMRAERLERERRAQEDGVTVEEAARRRGRLAAQKLIEGVQR
jgi:hypothetical protein